MTMPPSELRELRHRPVLPQETIAWLAPQPGEVWVDATFGAGGHARLILEHIGSTGRLIGIDQDASLLEQVRPRFSQANVTLVHANFDQLTTILAQLGLSTVDGVLADLGFCSDQMDDPSRGLSFQHAGPLDMRLDRSRGEPLSEWLQRIDERTLADLIYTYGEERYSRRIARKIVESRRLAPLTSTLQLAELVRSCVPRSPGSRIDPATRTFQALRIAVNDELQALETLLHLLPKVVRPGGRVGIISFHSLEDRRVKLAFRDAAHWKERTRKPIQASEAELASNPRSRSAKLRVALRIDSVLAQGNAT